MQNSSMYAYINPHPQFPEQEQLKCPRCDSTNTKFCYYNNYNLSQPRHFCKSCRRYWTKGGVLRNIPVGGGTRKNTKRSSSSSAVAYSPTAHHPKRPAPAASSVSPPASGTNIETFPLKENNYLEQFGSTSSLLGTIGGKFGNFLDGRNLQMDGLGFEPGTRQDPVQNVDPQVRLEGGSDNIAEEFLNVQGGNGWADLGMYTNPGSTFR